jgi:hypothetical protein
MRSTLHARRALLLVVLAGLTGCSYGQRATDAKSVRLNPHPTEMIDVSGVVADPLSVRTLRAVYRTHSSLPFCNGLNFPDGGPFPRHLNLDVPTIDVGGRLTARIAADRYAGLCGWRLSDINAVVRDGDRDYRPVLISRALADLYASERRSGPLRDVTTSYCGYRMTDFSCSDGPVGDDSYWPVLTDREHRQVKFVIRLGGYPPPANYHAPCRSLDDGAPYFPCRPGGG